MRGTATMLKQSSRQPHEEGEADLIYDSRRLIISIAKRRVDLRFNSAPGISTTGSEEEPDRKQAISIPGQIE
jgi:hypothetical protein